MPRLVGMLVLVVALAACGGTDWSGQAGTSAPTTARSAKAAQQAADVAAAERPYVDALVTSSRAEDPKGDPVATRCAASAIVHGFGVAAFSANGITPNQLRKPDSTLDALPDPSDAQIAATGAALQRCKLGPALASGLAEGLQIVDPATISCLAKQFSTGPATQRFVVLAVLHRKTDLEAAHAVVGVMSACIDLPSVLLQLGNLQVDATTRSCLVNALHGSDAQLKDYLALRMSGADADTTQQTFEQLTIAMNHCRAGATSGFTVPAA